MSSQQSVLRPPDSEHYTPLTDTSITLIEDRQSSEHDKTFSPSIEQVTDNPETDIVLELLEESKVPHGGENADPDEGLWDAFSDALLQVLFIKLEFTYR